MKRFLCLLSVVFVLISCFVPSVFADTLNTVATSSDIYLNGFCGSNSDGTVTAPCSVVGGFPLGFVRASDPTVTQPSITYWEYYDKWVYYRIDIGSIGTGQTNAAFHFRILDELGPYLYNNGIYEYNLNCYSGGGTSVPIENLNWTFFAHNTFTGHTYSTLSFTCALDAPQTLTNCYFVLGVHYSEASIPAYVSIPQYKWSGPVNGFGSTWYQDMDIYPNGDQYYIPVDEATYMEACYDAYSAANLFSYYGSGMISQVMDLGEIEQTVINESRILQQQNEALANRIISQVNDNVDAAEESINANLDEESQNIQGAIGDQTSELEDYFQPIIDHYGQVDEVGETIGENVSDQTLDDAEGTVSASLDIVNGFSGEVLEGVYLFTNEAGGMVSLLASTVPVLLSFGVGDSPIIFTFLFIVFFLFVFLILKIFRGD